MTTIMALTGAGISTAAGIPDFRGANGLWTLHPELRDIFEILAFMSKPKARVAAWRQIASMCRHDTPSNAHNALSRLQASGLLTTIATQNIDTLHELAGTKNVEHLHGVLSTSTCQRCRRVANTDDIIAGLGDEPDPHCHAFNPKKNRECGGVIRPDITFFGESLDRHVFKRVHDGMLLADEFWAIGTSLSVYPVASLMDEALALHKKTVIINKTRTAYDGRADIVIHDDIETAVPAFVDTCIRRKK